MKRIALHSNLTRTIAQLACILGMLPLPASAQNACAPGPSETKNDHQLRWRWLERRSSARAVYLNQPKGSP